MLMSCLKHINNVVKSVSIKSISVIYSLNLLSKGQKRSTANMMQVLQFTTIIFTIFCCVFASSTSPKPISKNYFTLIRKLNKLPTTNATTPSYKTNIPNGNSELHPVYQKPESRMFVGDKSGNNEHVKDSIKKLFGKHVHQKPYVPNHLKSRGNVNNNNDYNNNRGENVHFLKGGILHKPRVQKKFSFGKPIIVKANNINEALKSIRIEDNDLDYNNNEIRKVSFPKKKNWQGGLKNERVESRKTYSSNLYGTHSHPLLKHKNLSKNDHAMHSNASPFSSTTSKPQFRSENGYENEPKSQFTNNEGHGMIQSEPNQQFRSENGYGMNENQPKSQFENNGGHGMSQSEPNQQYPTSGNEYGMNTPLPPLPKPRFRSENGYENEPKSQFTNNEGHGMIQSEPNQQFRSENGYGMNENQPKSQFANNGGHGMSQSEPNQQYPTPGNGYGMNTPLPPLPKPQNPTGRMYDQYPTENSYNTPSYEGKYSSVEDALQTYFLDVAGKTSNFAYEVDDKKRNNFQTHRQIDDGVAATGSYSWKDPNGKLHVVDYVADHTGYKATVRNENGETQWGYVNDNNEGNYGDGGGGGYQNIGEYKQQSPPKLAYPTDGGDNKLSSAQGYSSDGGYGQSPQQGYQNGGGYGNSQQYPSERLDEAGNNGVSVKWYEDGKVNNDIRFDGNNRSDRDFYE